MSITATQLELLLPELSELVGAVTRQIWSRNDRRLVLELRLPGRDAFLLLGLEEGSPRAHLTAGKPAQPPHPAPFVMLLRKWLTGARLLSVAQLDQDRLLRLDFEGPDPTRAGLDGQAPPRVRTTLLAELTAPRANLLLLDRDGALIESLLHPAPRGLRPGDPWTQPPPLEHNPRDPLHLAALPPDGARSRALEAALDLAQAQDRARRLTADLLQRARQHLRAAQRRLSAVEADLQRAEDAQRFRRYGELLQSAWGQLPRGAASARVPDYYADDLPLVEIPLDPSLDLKTNIERYFRRYRKYHDALDLILQRLDDAERRLHDAQQLHHNLQRRLDDLAPLPPDARADALEALAVDLDIPAPRAQQPRARRAQANHLPYREFHDKKGRAILVGKGGKDNDALSIKIARGSDLWLHAHDHAGAHVVLRMNRNETIDHEALLDAATLAAWYSKGKDDTVIDILYTWARDVRKPKGLPPGRVTVAAAKTLALRLDPERLQRLLGRES